MPRSNVDRPAETTRSLLRGAGRAHRRALPRLIQLPTPRTWEVCRLRGELCRFHRWVSGHALWWFAWRCTATGVSPLGPAPILLG